MNLRDAINQAESEGYEMDTRPMKLNLIGIRNPANTSPQTFEDQIAYFYYDNLGNVVGRIVPATTNPSVYFLNNPMTSAGTAILKQGQYVDSYAIGMHRGLYQALVQKKPVTVIRDTDRNSYIDFFSQTETGLYGINIHRASLDKNNIAVIDKDSAGCQTFQNIDDFNEMMSMARNSKDLYGNNFTYTLIDMKEVYKKRANYAVIGLIIIGLTIYVYKISNR